MTTTLSHGLMHKEVEVYVNDIIIKPKQKKRDVPTLQKFFTRLGKYNLHLNP